MFHEQAHQGCNVQTGLIYYPAQSPGTPGSSCENCVQVLLNCITVYFINIQDIMKSHCSVSEHHTPGKGDILVQTRNDNNQPSISWRLDLGKYKYPATSTLGNDIIKWWTAGNTTRTHQASSTLHHFSTISVLHHVSKTSVLHTAPFQCYKHPPHCTMSAPQASFTLHHVSTTSILHTAPCQHHKRPPHCTMSAPQVSSTLHHQRFQVSSPHAPGKNQHHWITARQ